MLRRIFISNAKSCSYSKYKSTYFFKLVCHTLIITQICLNLPHFTPKKGKTGMRQIGVAPTPPPPQVGQVLRTRWSPFNKFGKVKILGYKFCNYWGGLGLIIGGYIPPSPLFRHRSSHQLPLR